MPDTEPTTITKARWAELETALGHLNRAGFELERAARVVRLEPLDTARTWIDDVRRSLGQLALLMADTPDAAGHPVGLARARHDCEAEPMILEVDERQAQRLDRTIDRVLDRG